MPIAAGTRLGVYEFIAPIGAGGMGEVYRARDTRLGRDVALKILPDGFAHDPERLARFTREAQVLASLNHPHIAGIYGLEEGVQASAHWHSSSWKVPHWRSASHRVPFPSPRRSASRASWPTHSTPLTRQGIIHRDLKPANVKLRPDGTVKVLDFGLAKSMDADPVNAAHSPTITALSRAGVILGTAAYMSPEQARGRPVDKRADIWAFGCVLYQMLSGVSPFAGETTTDTLAAVVGHASRLVTPAGRHPRPRARAAPASALEKDPKRRLRDIGDARVLLHERTDAVVVPAALAREACASWQAVAVLALATARGARRRSLASDATRSTGRRVPPTHPSDIGQRTDDGTEYQRGWPARRVCLGPRRRRQSRHLGAADRWRRRCAPHQRSRRRSVADISPDGTLIAFRSDRGAGGIYVDSGARRRCPAHRARGTGPEVLARRQDDCVLDRRLAGGTRGSKIPPHIRHRREWRDANAGGDRTWRAAGDPCGLRTARCCSCTAGVEPPVPRRKPTGGSSRRAEGKRGHRCLRRVPRRRPRHRRRVWPALPPAVDARRRLVLGNTDQEVRAVWRVVSTRRPAGARGAGKLTHGTS